MTEIHNPTIQNLLITKEQLDSELGERSIIVYDDNENVCNWCYTIVYVKSLKRKVKVYNKVIFCNDYVKLTDTERVMDENEISKPSNSITLDSYTRPTYKQFVDLIRDEKSLNDYKFNSRYWHYTDKKTFNIFRDQKYHFIPELVFETENFLGFEYLNHDDGWRAATSEDFIYNLRELPEIVIMTGLCKNVAKEMYTLQQNEKVNLPEKDQKWWYEQILIEPNRASSMGDYNIAELERQYPGVTYKSIIPNDVYIRKSTTAEIEWKFHSIENIMFGHAPNTNMIISTPCLDSKGQCQYIKTSQDYLNLYYNGMWLQKPMPV